ncbi:N-acyl homoserine lactonase AttM [Syntrophobacter sp. SbD1]|nr:N-acyl homoserine lactonase AttM [Syntrophobacter sp. SbD1]
MKLYCFESGHLVMDKSMLTAGRGMGTMLTIPIPFFLIQHPKGNLLYDTGMPKELVTDARRYWGDALVDFTKPALKKEEYCVNHLAKLGIKPEDISYVVQSHLHLDHTGGVMDFPKATVLVQRKEMEWAYTADPSMKFIYMRGDFDHAHIKYRYIEGWNQNPFDVFGDGSVQILFTPGHSPGHQTLLLNLPKSGRVLLTGDACYTTENLEEEVMPGVVWSLEETRKSIEMIRHLKATGATILIGHDPDLWPTYKKAPEFYE